MLFFIVLTDNTSGVDVLVFIYFSLIFFSQHINKTNETKNTLPVNSKDAHFFYVKETKNFVFQRRKKTVIDC